MIRRVFGPKSQWAVPRLCACTSALITSSPKHHRKGTDTAFCNTHLAMLPYEYGCSAQSTNIGESDVIVFRDKVQDLHDVGMLPVAVLVVQVVRNKVLTRERFISIIGVFYCCNKYNGPQRWVAGLRTCPREAYPHIAHHVKWLAMYRYFALSCRSRIVAGSSTPCL